tara:strand:- start:1458 stop:1679 length:222 start_codon:yes stop_codon:yes gene_type:complete
VELSKIKQKIKDITYEESLEALDLLIQKLQDNQIPVSELQDTYLAASLYLSNCENMLKNLENDFEEIDLANED